jgi:hypothetical protein
MSNPVATPTDLELYLGLAAGSIDTDRAELILSLAQAKCERITSPLSSAAQDIVLEVAARAYNNVTSAHQAGIGSAQVSYGSPNSSVGIGGLYLSKANKAELRLIAGRGSAFSHDTMPTGVNAVQSVTVSASSGTFTLTFSGATTSALAYNATAAQVQTALAALAPIGAGNVSVTGAYSVEFTNRLGLWPMPLLTADGSGLAGGTVSVQTTTEGVAAPGSNLPPWDNDYSRDNRFPTSQFYGY